MNLSEFEELSFLQELENFLGKIEGGETSISEEDLLKIERAIQDLRVITENILKIINRLLYILEQKKKKERENIKILEEKIYERAFQGEITSQSAYVIPILETLYELGGKGEVKEILSIMEMKMKEILKEKDYEVNKSGEIRWINNARWCRLKLVQDGLLRKNSPKGVWELSEEGYKYIQEYLSHKGNG